MDLSNLRPAVGSTTRETRVGRGPGSGKGGTSTRGHKGAKSRSGYSREALAASKALEKVGIEELRAAGLVGRKDLVKILGNGAITRKVEVEANAFSAAAEKAIVEAGGSINKVK